MPQICSKIKTQYNQIKTLKNEFVLAYDKAQETKTREDRDKARILQNKLIVEREALKDMLWPFKEIPSQELKKQYNEQVEIMKQTNILQELPNSRELGIIDIKGRSCPIPSLKEVKKAMQDKKNKEI